MFYGGLFFHFIVSPVSSPSFQLFSILPSMQKMFKNNI